MKKEVAEKGKQEPRPSIRVRRLSIRRKLTNDCRVHTPKGDGNYRYFDEQSNRAVVTLDTPFTDAVTGLTVRSAFIDADTISVIEEPEKENE